MKKFSVGFLLLGVVLFLAACGPQEPIVEAKAADLNLGAADLGSGFTLAEELPLESILERTQVKSEDKGALVDANRRVFTNGAAVTATQPISGTPPLTSTQVIVTVLVYNSASAADSGLNEIRDALKEVVKQDAPLDTVSPTPVPIGDRSEFLGAGPVRGAQVYLFVFRRSSVVGVVLATGPASLSQAWVLSLGQALLSRVPAPVAK